MAKKIKTKFNKFRNMISQPSRVNVHGLVFVLIILTSLAFTILIFETGRMIGREENVNLPKVTSSPLENKIRDMTAGYPIEGMASYISQRDPKVAAYLVAIAKKESNWGKEAPEKDGQECWNFWGYRDNINETDSGYACFNSPRQAVQIVGTRLNDLVNQNIDTPQEMKVWKCGWDCSWDNPGNVRKWIQDVGYYYHQVYQ